MHVCTSNGASHDTIFRKSRPVVTRNYCADFRCGVAGALADGNSDLGAGFELPGNLIGGVRYVNGLTNTANDPSGATKTYNSIWQFYLGLRMFKR